jgi:hypothetical protein
MARRVFMHVGTPKTGTSYLQSVLWANKPLLREQGVLLPGRGFGEHFEASNVVRDTEGSLAHMSPHAMRAWDRLLTEMAAWQGDAVISHELFAATRRSAAAEAVRRLSEVSEEVHVVVTARDLARQIPAEWQEETKHGRSLRISGFYERLQGEDRKDWFWRVQDLPRVMRRWTGELPSGHGHVVVVPQPGAPKDLLWNRFAGVLGIDAEAVDRSATRPNESLGVLEIETLRRANEHLPEGLEGPKIPLLVRQVLAEGLLAARPGAVRFAPPPSEHPWVVERGNRMVDELAALDLDVIGSLDELRPAEKPAEGPNPDEVDDSAVAQVAVETIAAVLFRTHELENRQLKQRVSALERDLAAARTAHADEQAARLRSRLRRIAGRVKRKLLRR